MKKQYIYIEILKRVNKAPIGTRLRLECDDKKIPHSQFWRNRLKDSELDNCLKLIKKPKKGAVFNGK